MNKELKIAIQAALEGGAEIMKIYQNEFDVVYKDDNSPLTIADQKCNDIINPLDGTKEFVKRNGEFTVNIALVKNGKPQLGVIYVPDTKVLYYADVIKGDAFKCVLKNHDENIQDIEEKAKIIEPNSKTNDKVKVVGSRSHMSSETEDFVDSLKEKYKEVEIVSKGSSLKFCLVAEGNADIYPRFAPTMEWDTAAGQAICEAVNLQVISKETDEPLLYNKESKLELELLC